MDEGQRATTGHHSSDDEVVTLAEATRAGRSWWDAQAEEYQAEHGRFLAGLRAGDAASTDPLPPALVWGPEGLTEDVAGLLGPLAGRDVLEIGARAAQGATWAATRGARAVAIDLSMGMLRHAVQAQATHSPRLASVMSEDGHPKTAPAVRALTRSSTGGSVFSVQADATRLPFAAAAFDIAFSAYGALPFTPDAEAVLRGVNRSLREGGRWVFSVTHPLRWAFPDDPGPVGLQATLSYFNRRPYTERDAVGQVTYVEYHRTIGDWVRLLHRTGFHLVDLVEPEWPEDLDETWGGWSRLRGERIPGTAIFCCRK